jgi:hypothetical protein
MNYTRCSRRAWVAGFLGATGVNAAPDNEEAVAKRQPQSAMLFAIARAVENDERVGGKLIVKIIVTSETEAFVRTSTDYNQEAARGENINLRLKDGKWQVDIESRWQS